MENEIAAIRYDRTRNLAVRERSIGLRVSEFRRELPGIKISDKHLCELVQLGWNIDTVREARDISIEHNVAFHTVTKLAMRGFPMPAVEEILQAHSEHAMNVADAARCWIALIHGAITPDEVELFRHFLDSAEDLFTQAEYRLKSAVTRSRSFIMGRLLDYIRRSGNDFERVLRELVDEPEILLSRILRSNERSLDPVSGITTGIDPTLLTDEGYPDLTNHDQE